jgi:hypothetical protein
VNVGSLPVRSEARARAGKLVESEHSDAGVPDGRILQRQDGAPGFLPVLGVGGKNEAGVIECVVAAHDELRIERIDNRSIDIAIDLVEPVLRAVRIKREKLAQILHEVVDAVASYVGRCENIVREG